MFKTKISSFIVIAASISILFLVQPQKMFYHSLFISDSFSDNASISNDLYTLTRRPHVAGSEANAEATAYVLSKLTSYNIPTHIKPYYTALSYPVSRSLTLITRSSTQTPVDFSLEQESYDGDLYSDVAKQVLPTFHAYAKSGTAFGPIVYANYGRVEDYRTLKEVRVNISDTVVLARYGKIYRGDMIENAYKEGAVGILIFTDRKDYGGGGGDKKWFPDDTWMPHTGVQVGSVLNEAGDPTTPGWASTEDCERLSNEEVEKAGDFPLIPSLPISWKDGYEIMRSVDGEVANDDWQGGEDAPVYRVGQGPGIVNLTYLGEQVIRRIENVIGIIEGAEEPDRFVILGNHRDAWAFGAVDPNSGTASLLEVARRLWNLQKKGWKPRRSIIFCNWDAEEYGLMGSTEWVEENRQMLALRVVVYLNVDVAVSGPGFKSAATPQLDELLIEAAKQVKDPDNSSQTIYDSWTSSTNDPVIGRLGGINSDYAAFVQHIGVPAADISFGGVGRLPVYHSRYDDFTWMKKFGDPMFQRHAAVASIFGLVALKLADNEILPFNYLHYALELQKSADHLKGQVLDEDLTLVPLFKSINELKKAALKINDERKTLEGRKRWTLMSQNGQRVRELNDRLMMAERAFTDREGVRGRPWYKHLIYAPSKYNDYGSKSFPGIYDALEKAKSINTADSWHSVKHEIWRVSRAITQASLCLKGELT